MGSSRPEGIKEPKRYGKRDSRGVFHFKNGNPGRPEGSLNKVTLLKNKILDAAMKLDLNGQIVRFTKKGKKYFIREVPATDIMKTAATFVPKELKGEGFDQKNITVVFPGLKKNEPKPKQSSDNRLRPTAKAKNLSRKS